MSDDDVFSGCEVGKTYEWQARSDKKTIMLECRERRDGKEGFSWGIPGNPNQSRSEAWQAAGWVFAGAVPVSK